MRFLLELLAKTPYDLVTEFDLVQKIFSFKHWRAAWWTWILTSIMILMALEYTFAEMLHPHTEQPADIFDLGFYLTSPLYEFLKKNPIYNDYFAQLNTWYVQILSAYGIYIAIKRDEIGTLTAAAVVFTARCLCGLATAVPVHSEYLPSSGDWPNVLWGSGGVLDQGDASLGSTSIKDEGFFTFFSGHVAVPAMVVAKLRHDYHKSTDEARKTMLLWSIALVHCGNVFQIIRLLATRGHWSIDIFIGGLLGAWSTLLVPKIDEAAVQSSSEAVGGSDEAHSARRGRLGARSPRRPGKSPKPRSRSRKGKQSKSSGK